MNKEITSDSTSDSFEQAKFFFLRGLENYHKELYDDAEYFFFLSLKLLPDRLSTLINLSMVLIKLKKLETASEIIARGINLFPTNEIFYLNQGLLFVLNKEWEKSLDSFNKAIRIKLDYAEAYYNRGNTLQELRRLEEALFSYDQVIYIKPDCVEAYNNRGNALQELGRLEEALVSYDQAILFKPDYVEAYNNRGNALQELRRLEEALVSYDQAIRIKPEYAEAYYNRGNVLQELKRLEEAINSYDQATYIKPDYTEAYYNLGNTYQELRRLEEALVSYDQAIRIKSDYAEAYNNRGNALQEFKRLEEALVSYDQAIHIKPDYLEAYYNLGNTYQELGRLEEALVSYDQAIRIKPDYAIAWSNKGSVFNLLKQHSESAKCYLKALNFSIEDTYWMGEAHHQMMLGCDWNNYENITNQIFNKVNQGKKSTRPFGFQGIAKSEELLKKCSEIYSNDKYPILGNLAWRKKYKHNKVRIGYLCDEFRQQATSILMTRVWELHDISKFEIFAFDNGWNDGSDYRKRIERAFGNNIFDISKLSDLVTAKLIQSNEIDILVNLNGFFGKARQGVFSYRPAPIQVNYLGFPGTIGTKYMDYIFADKVVIPDESKKYYVEKVVHFPNSYQANDNRRIISERQITKIELGLPEERFVFACFNNNYKIVPSTFDLWCRILAKSEGSVLWLLEDNPTAKKNLVKEAAARGIDSTRLVFAERLEPSMHLARHQFADLFLDTFPYNAHTTCSDALWAGLPLLTLMGESFASRVAASLLRAIDLPELVTVSVEQYENLAIELAKNPDKLSLIKQKLAKNKLTAPLFDTPKFTQYIEKAYTRIMERNCADLPPEHILIEPY